MRCLWLSFVLCCFATTSLAQEIQVGETISRDVLGIYSRGLGYLQSKQNAEGTWEAGEGNGPGTTALAMLAFLASGEDPNFGPYRETIRAGLRHIISKQSGTTGYMGPSMYHHGFATLALSEAYGVLDDEDLFRGSTAKNQRRVGEAVELAVRAALTAQSRNGFGGWRYSPAASDADTSVSGSVMMGLLAARNAGFEIPDESVDRAIAYFQRMTARNGVVGYSSVSDGNGESMARSSIVNLVLSIAGRKELPAYTATRAYIVANRDAPAIWPEYARYYQAQALFQSDVEAWRAWNARVIQQLKKKQKDDGSFEGDLGVTNSTSMNLLTLAVNFRFLPIYER